MAEDFLQQSSRLMVIGTVLGIIGYFPLFVSVAFKCPGEHFPSNIAMVLQNWDDPAARAFFGFEFSSAMCLLTSWYPYCVWNACCKPELNGCRIPFFSSMSWANFRWWTLPVAVILKACVPTQQASKMSLHGSLGTLVVHSLDVLKFVGYIFSEAHTLNIWPFKCPFCLVPKNTREYNFRFWTLFLSVLTSAMFVVSQSVRHALHNKMLVFKCFSLVNQLLANLSMYLNLVLIWWYSPERQWKWNISREEAVLDPSSFRQSENVDVELTSMG